MTEHYNIIWLLLITFAWIVCKVPLTLFELTGLQKENAQALVQSILTQNWYTFVFYKIIC